MAEIAKSELNLNPFDLAQHNGFNNISIRPKFPDLIKAYCANPEGNAVIVRLVWEAGDKNTARFGVSRTSSIGISLSDEVRRVSTGRFDITVQLNRNRSLAGFLGGRMM